MSSSSPKKAEKLEVGSAALPPGHSLRLLRPNAAADGKFCAGKGDESQGLEIADDVPVAGTVHDALPRSHSDADFLSKLKSGSAMTGPQSTSSSGPVGGVEKGIGAGGSAPMPSFPVMAASTSNLLGRLSAFLPQLAASNKELEAKIAAEGREAVDVEAVGEDEEHIAMVSDDGRHGHVL